MASKFEIEVIIPVKKFIFSSLFILSIEKGLQPLISFLYETLIFVSLSVRFHRLTTVFIKHRPDCAIDDDLKQPHKYFFVEQKKTYPYIKNNLSIKAGPYMEKTCPYMEKMCPYIKTCPYIKKPVHIFFCLILLQMSNHSSPWTPFNSPFGFFLSPNGESLLFTLNTIHQFSISKSRFPFIKKSIVLFALNKN